MKNEIGAELSYLKFFAGEQERIGGNERFTDVSFKLPIQVGNGRDGFPDRRNTMGKSSWK